MVGRWLDFRILKGSGCCLCYEGLRAAFCVSCFRLVDFKHTYTTFVLLYDSSYIQENIPVCGKPLKKTTLDIKKFLDSLED